MVLQQHLDDIVADRRPILEDIISLLAEGRDEQKATAVDALTKLEEPKYSAMLQTLQRQCDKYERVVGKDFLEPYGLAPKDPTQLRRYFIVLEYIRPISDGNDGSKSLAAQRIATMNPEDYSYAIQTLRDAAERPTGNEGIKELLWTQGGLVFKPVQQIRQQERRPRGDEVYDPKAAERAREGREYAFAALHHGGVDIYRRR